MSRLINWEDRNTCILFGDAAAAAVLKPVEDGYGFLSFYLGSDGRGSELLLLPAGGARLPASQETVENHLHSVHMAGAEVFKFAVRIMGDASLEALKRANLTPQDIDLVVPHQANVRIIDAAAKRLGIDREKIYVNVERFGNTSSASVGVALVECVEQGLIKSGDIILLVGFGAGLTWGSAVIRWV
jgi:3-oxoacyl-[acyl-carrier-protein] synthase-3